MNALAEALGMSLPGCAAIPATYRERGQIDIALQVLLQTAKMREQGLPPQTLSRSNFRDAYWTVAQMLAHHSSGGCNLGTGDLLGTGTQSGPLPAQPSSSRGASSSNSAPGGPTSGSQTAGPASSSTSISGI